MPKANTQDTITIDLRGIIKETIKAGERFQPTEENINAVLARIAIDRMSYMLEKDCYEIMKHVYLSANADLK